MSSRISTTPDLVGVYVTDDYIDAAIGFDKEPTVPKDSISKLNLEYGAQIRAGLRKRIYFSQFSDMPDPAFAELGRWINNEAPEWRAIGIACYGPFAETRGPRKSGTAHKFGRLAIQSHGRLQTRDLEEMLAPTLRSTGRTGPLVVVPEVDVAAAAIGYVYESTHREGADLSVAEQAIVFVKASRGIGGGFMKGTTSWQGRLHPEMAQLFSPPWPHEDRLTSRGRLPGAMTPGSIEALASVSAMEHYYAPLSFEELVNDPDHECWDREAWYLAHLAWAISCCIDPHKIVFGGRIVRHGPDMLNRIRDVFDGLLRSRSTEYREPFQRDLGTHLTMLGGAEEPGVVGALCVAAMEVAPRSVLKASYGQNS